MLVEESPSQLLSQHSLTSFEDVFFKLCSAADDKNKRIIPQKNTGTHKVVFKRSFAADLLQRNPMHTAIKLKR